RVANWVEEGYCYPSPPLRTVHESFPSYGSSKSRTTPLRSPLSRSVVLRSPPGARAQKGVAPQQGVSEASNPLPGVRPCRPEEIVAEMASDPLPLRGARPCTSPFANREGCIQLVPYCATKTSFFG